MILSENHNMGTMIASPKGSHAPSRKDKAATFGNGGSQPPRKSVVATAETSIRKLMHGSNKRAHLWENSKTLHKGLKELGFQLGTEEPQSAIIAVIMPDLEKGAAMWEALIKGGLYVNLARPPATPANMTLLRCSLCAEHSEEEVGEILSIFEQAGKAVGII